MRFNSQRDGILHIEIFAISIKFIEFQFPTGWNSTLCNFSISSNSSSFNSQRDGILLFYAGALLCYFAVSIPNGMEFYNDRRPCFCHWRKFQFPTGWNSTPSDAYIGRARMKFQFPTGWNSTISASSLKYAKCRFNSQRDGILRAASFCSFPCQLFQFPTGWNSTILSGRRNSFEPSFNSQRDGILL